jgi:hypothetical protein
MRRDNKVATGGGMRDGWILRGLSKFEKLSTKELPSALENESNNVNKI